MSQGPLCPNLSQKVQKEVSQMANCNLSPVILLGGLSVNLNHLKSENVITPIPGLAHTTPFNIFKMTRGLWSCSTRKSVKSSHIYQFNPIRSSAAMTELSKKRWVSPISTVLIFLFATPKLISFAQWQF